MHVCSCSLHAAHAYYLVAPTLIVFARLLGRSSEKREAELAEARQTNRPSEPKFGTLTLLLPGLMLLNLTGKVGGGDLASLSDIRPKKS